MYIPPVPKKYIVGNTSIRVLKERSFLLNIFLKQMTRCPYLLESEELEVFISPASIGLIETKLGQLCTAEEVNSSAYLARIIPYYNFTGFFGDAAI